MSLSDEEAYWAAVRSNFKLFLQQAFATIYPGRPFDDNWSIDAIVYHLECAFQGQMPRLIINLPPRHLKSFIVSVAFPAFILGLDPEAKISCISYSDELARVLSRDFRRLIESPWYRMVFSNVDFPKVTEGEAVTSDGGGRFSTSVGGTLTGRGGDFIIVDDPIKAEDAQSESARHTNNEWFKTTLLSRLEDKQRSVLILVMQRLHVNDLRGFIEGSGGFHKLSLPAIALTSQEIPVGDGEIYCREQGEALHPERESLEVLQKIRDQIGPYNFAAQYQQSPQAIDGPLFKRSHLQIVNRLPALHRHCIYWVSVDGAQSTSERADSSVIIHGVSDVSGHYVLEVERGRWDYETLLSRVLPYATRYRRIFFIVEKASSGISLIESLIRRGLYVFIADPRSDKMARTLRALPIFADGRVFIVDQEGRNAWVQPFINELLSFPFGAADDQVDAIVQAVYWAEPRVVPIGRITF